MAQESQVAGPVHQPQGVGHLVVGEAVQRQVSLSHIANHSDTDSYTQAVV